MMKEKRSKLLSSLLLLYSSLYGTSTAFLHGSHVRLPLRHSTRTFEQTQANNNEKDDDHVTNVIVIGGGWAGFSVADALSVDTRSNITILDGSPRGPGGLAGGWKSEKLGRSVEAGIHGFWREYRNTFRAIESIGLDLDDVLTNYTPSLLVAQSGRVALAPVLGGEDTEGVNEATIQDKREQKSIQSSLVSVLEALPAPLDLALLADFSQSRLTVTDRLSGLGLLGPWLEFGQEDPKSWLKYDKVSADNLFRNIAGVSERLYLDLVEPLLHVLPMTPGYDCSAAAALSCFHVFALQSKGAFDVRWCRGSITDKIFNPWVEKLTSTGRVSVAGSSKVQKIEKVKSTYNVHLHSGDILSCDAVVLAVGCVSAARLAQESPCLRDLPCTSRWSTLRGITCVAVRLFLRRDPKCILPVDIAEAMKDSPVAVCGPRIGNIPELVETGFCIYDLSRLQDTFKNDDDVTAIEVDFFRADTLAEHSDDYVVSVTLEAISKALGVAPLDRNLVKDISVVRARKAVSHFCLGSAEASPLVRLDKGLYVCGDWVDRTGHASWSTEKSVVTGRQAAASLGSDFGLSVEGHVIPAAQGSDEAKSLRESAQKITSSLARGSIPPSPWSLLSQLRNTD